MKSIKTGLLIAAAFAVVPAMAQAQDTDQRHEHRGDRGDRGDVRRNDARPPAPPQAQPAPRPQMSAPLQAGDNGAPRGAYGGAFGGNRSYAPPGGDQRPQWQGNRGNWNRGDARPTPPQAINPAQPAPDRGQWQRNGGQYDRGRDGMNVGVDDRRNGARQWNNDDRRNMGDRRWNNDNRNWNNDNRNWGNRDAYRGDRQWSGGDRNGSRYNGGYRHNPNWRNDRRYDWQGWRNSHRDLFRGRYYAPRGYHYRSVYRGFYLEPFFYGSNYWLSDPYEYRLPPVDWPLRWVRYYDDALLVDTTTGEVIDVIQGFFF